MRCNCPEPQKSQVNYNAVTLTPYNTSGFRDEVVEDTVHRNSFGLGVSVNFELEKLAASTDVNANFGFGFAMAFSCDCVGDEYKYPDPIDHVKIFVTDVQTAETREITDYFAAYEYSNGGLISLDEFFSKKEDWHDGFQFELVEYDDIPAAAIFTVEAFLKSGKKFSEQTDQINFFE